MTQLDQGEFFCSIGYTVKPQGERTGTMPKSFNIMLKVSFFKNELHRISFKEKSVVFTNLEQKSKSFSVELDDIDGVYVYGNPIREIEIRTKNSIIIGNFKSTRTSNHALSILKNVFKEKLAHIYQGGI